MEPMVDYEKFGKSLRLMRQRMNITQQYICEVIGISNTHYSNIENGLAKPSLEVLVSLCNFFDIPLSTSLLSKDAHYRIPFEIKNIFNQSSNSIVVNVLDIMTYAKLQLYDE